MSEDISSAQEPTKLTQDEKAYAGLAHALMISTWWIGPLIIFLTKNGSRFVRFHSLQALLWQIIYTLLYVIGMVLVFVGVFSTIVSMPQGKTVEPQFPTAFFLVFPFFWLVIIAKA